MRHGRLRKPPQSCQELSGGATPACIAQLRLGTQDWLKSCLCAADAGVVQPPSQQATRHARRVYVGGLPPTANEQNIATFFSNALAAVGGTTAGPGAPPPPPSADYWAGQAGRL